MRRTDDGNAQRQIFVPRVRVDSEFPRDDGDIGAVRVEQDPQGRLPLTRVLAASVEQAAHVSGQDGIGQGLAELADGLVGGRGPPRGHRTVGPDERLFDIAERPT